MVRLLRWLSFYDPQTKMAHRNRNTLGRAAARRSLEPGQAAIPAQQRFGFTHRSTGTKVSQADAVRVCHPTNNSGFAFRQRPWFSQRLFGC